MEEDVVATIAALLLFVDLLVCGLTRFYLIYNYSTRMELLTLLFTFKGCGLGRITGYSYPMLLLRSSLLILIIYLLFLPILYSNIKTKSF